MTKIKEIRERENLSQKELSEKTGVTAAYINNLESGAKTNPSIKVLLKIAHVLGVTVDDLIEKQYII